MQIFVDGIIMYDVACMFGSAWTTNESGVMTAELTDCEELNEDLPDSRIEAYPVENGPLIVHAGGDMLVAWPCPERR